MNLGERTLKAFRERTEGFTRDSLPHQGDFETNPSLRSKVDEEGHMKPFTGNTVIFGLDEEIRQAAQDIQNRLYAQCPELMGDLLDGRSFHVTLHDLANGESAAEVERQMARIQEPALEVVRHLKNGRNEPIKMYTTRVFNMVNTSVVWGLEPADDDACRRLMDLYDAFQPILYLPYLLTPHITIGYYRPGRYNSSMMEKLRAFFDQAAHQPRLEVRLRMDRLALQNFTDMNHYHKIG